MLKYFLDHIIKFHPMKNTIQMIDKKLCDENECTFVVEKSLHYCSFHNDIHQINDKFDSDTLLKSTFDDNNNTFKCIDGKILDINKLTNKLDVTDSRMSDLTKDKIGKHLVAALKDLANKYLNEEDLCEIVVGNTSF